jgi:hypothetical protein
MKILNPLAYHLIWSTQNNYLTLIQSFQHKCSSLQKHFHVLCPIIKLLQLISGNFLQPVTGGCQTDVKVHQWVETSLNWLPITFFMKTPIMTTTTMTNMTHDTPVHDMLTTVHSVAHSEELC